MSAAHWHLVLNHIPLLGIVFGAAVLAYGLWRNSEDVQNASLGVLTVAGLAAIAVYLTGEPAEEVVEGLAGVSHDAIEAHEEVGLYALIAGIATGVVSFGALLYGRLRQGLVRWTAVLALVFAVLSAGLIGYTANQGGKISHPELRGATVSTVEGGEEEGTAETQEEGEEHNDENEE